eukprot:4580404-Pyramimonas_sp.AAC.1
MMRPEMQDARSQRGRTLGRPTAINTGTHEMFTRCEYRTLVRACPGPGRMERTTSWEDDDSADVLENAACGRERLIEESVGGVPEGFVMKNAFLHPANEHDASCLWEISSCVGLRRWRSGFAVVGWPNGAAESLRAATPRVRLHFPGINAIFLERRHVSFGAIAGSFCWIRQVIPTRLDASTRNSARRAFVQSALADRRRSSFRCDGQWCVMDGGGNQWPGEAAISVVRSRST